MPSFPPPPGDACCAPQMLVRSGVGSVALCAGCGSVHLNLQYLTLRFEPDAFAELAGLLGAARERVLDTPAPHEARQAPPWPPALH